jgi:hypothetical protein
MSLPDLLSYQDSTVYLGSFMVPNGLQDFFSISTRKSLEFDEDALKSARICR